MFDGSTEIFEKVWRPATVNVIATLGTDIMIAEQSQPDHLDFISLINGRADQGDDMLVEAQRELLEESGYASADWELYREENQHGKVIWDSYYYIARECEKVAEQHLDPGEQIKIKFISFRKFLKLADEPRFRTTPEFRDFLRELKEDKEKGDTFYVKLFGDDAEGSLPVISV